jgi:hypothetical protein
MASFKFFFFGENDKYTFTVNNANEYAFIVFFNPHLASDLEFIYFFLTTPQFVF